MEAGEACDDMTRVMRLKYLTERVLIECEKAVSNEGHGGSLWDSKFLLPFKVTVNGILAHYLADSLDLHPLAENE